MCIRDSDDTMWEPMAQCIQGLEVVGVSGGSGSNIKQVQWWNDEVKEPVKKKQEPFTGVGDSASRREKWLPKRSIRWPNQEAEKAITVPKSKAYEKLYQGLDTKHGEKDVSKLTRAKERRTRDVGDRCIKNQDSKILVEEA